MLGLSGKRRTDRLTLDLAELSTQVSFARAARLDDQLAGTGASPGQAQNALADVAALLTGPDGTLDLAHPGPDVVLLDGTGLGARKNGTVGAPGDRVDRPVRTRRAPPGHLGPVKWLFHFHRGGGCYAALGDVV